MTILKILCLIKIIVEPIHLPTRSVGYLCISVKLRKSPTSGPHANFQICFPKSSNNILESESNSSFVRKSGKSPKNRENYEIMFDSYTALWALNFFGTEF